MEHLSSLFWRSCYPAQCDLAAQDRLLGHLDGLKEGGIFILSGNAQRHRQVTRPDECEVESRRCNDGVDVLNCGGVFYGGNASTLALAEAMYSGIGIAQRIGA